MINYSNMTRRITALILFLVKWENLQCNDSGVQLHNAPYSNRSIKAHSINLDP